MAADDENTEDLFDNFLESRGHELTETWDTDQNKKQCPECGGIHTPDTDVCSVCGWEPTDPTHPASE